MRDLWYADNRDLVKWATLWHIAREHSLRGILQVPYWRPEKGRPCFRFGTDRVRIADEVWNFFRDIRHIEKLAHKLGVWVKVHAEAFDPADRASYLASVLDHVRECPRPLLVFLDPDTGLEPKDSRDKHTTAREIRATWRELRKDDWLVLYQHARRQLLWVDTVSQELRVLCDDATVEVARSEKLGKDVAFMCIERRAD